MERHPEHRDLQAGEESDESNASFLNRLERSDSSSSSEEASSLTSRQLPEASPSNTQNDEQPGGELNGERTPEGSPFSVHAIDEVPLVKFKATLPVQSTGLLDEQPQILKMPYFLKVESEAYDPQNFKDAMTAQDLKDEQARDDFINRLKTTVRWRVGPNNEIESNAKFVHWSDGSETFHVGGEAFDVVHHPLSNDQSHLYVRHGSFYQPQGPIKDKMTLRPKLDSNFGQSHVQGLRNRAVNKPKTGGVKVLTDMGADPMQDHERRVNEEKAQLRQAEREEARRIVKLNRRKLSALPKPHCTSPSYWEDGHSTQATSSVPSDVDEFDEDDESSSGSTPKAKKLSQSSSDESPLIGGAKRKTKRGVCSSSESS